MKYLKLLILFVIISCNNSSKEYSFQPPISEQKENTIRIYRFAQKVDLFSIKINNDFIYYDSSKSIPPYPPGLLINEYLKKSDSLFIYLKINKRDTSFLFNAKDIDSLLIGYSGKNTFYLRTEKEKAAWIVE